MKLLADTADLDVIKELYSYAGMDGVTTNPSILAKTGQDPRMVLQDIREWIHDDELHVQVIADTAEGMVEDAHAIVSLLGKDTFVKVPCVKEGYKAMKILATEGIQVTGTAVYMPLQAWLAAKAGAVYTAPYINRIDNMGYDGIRVCKEIHEMFIKNEMKCGILAASFKNSQQILELAECGIAASTAALDVIYNMMKNAAVDTAVDVFIKDWKKLTGRERF